jgi:hypothetical protein
MLKLLGRVFAVLMLGGTGVVGVRNGIVELPGAHTALQEMVTLGVLAYGLVGLAAAAAVAARHRWSFRLTLVWAVLITWVAAAAIPAYGGANATLGASLSGGVVVALIGSAIAWIVRRCVVIHDPPLRITHR